MDCRRRSQRRTSPLKHHHNIGVQAERHKGRGVACVPGSSSSSHNHHRHPTSCVAAFAPKLRRQAFSCFLLFFRLLIFGNAQLCLYAGQIVNAPKIDTVDCHSLFFFCMYTRIKKKKCNGFHLDLGDTEMDLIKG